MRISKTVLDQPRSGIRTIFEAAAGFPDTLHLEIGEPMFATPGHIVEAGCAALHNGDTKYTPNAGVMPLRQMIAETASKEKGLPVTAANVLVGVGGVEVINNAIRTVCEAGDEILLPDPAWPNYLTMACIANVKPVCYTLRARNQFQPDMAELESLVTPRTRMLIVNSPSNPLGVMFGETVLKQLVDFANRHDIILLSDEAYEKIIYDGRHISPLKFDVEGRVIATYTFSKTYAMTGWRVGYAITAPEIIDQMTKLQEAYVSSVPGSMQAAATAALKGSQDCVEKMRATYAEHRAIAAAVLDAAGVDYFMPSGAFYMWINIGRRDSTAFAVDLVNREHVAVAPGSAFGASGEGYVRISLASPKKVVEEGVARLVKAIQS